MTRYYKFLMFASSFLLIIVNCSNKKPQEDKTDLKKKTFNSIISSIEIIELPDTIFCGIDSSKPVNEYGNEIIQIAPKPSEWTGVYGKLPPENDKEYIIYTIKGDINYPYLFTYTKDGLKLDSLYLHIGPCLGDESVTISNTTIINKDHSIDMIDTTKYVHYNIDNIRTVDSIYITKRYLKLNTQNRYEILKEDRYRSE